MSTGWYVCMPALDGAVFVWFSLDFVPFWEVWRSADRLTAENGPVRGLLCKNDEGDVGSSS